jgi:hypothetical protein
VQEAATLHIDHLALQTAMEQFQAGSKIRQMLSDNAPEVLTFIQRAVDDAATRRQSTSGCIPLSLFFPKVKEKWFEATFEIDEERLPYVFDWTRSNLEYLFDLGYVTGQDLADELYDEGEYTRRP